MFLSIEDIIINFLKTENPNESLFIRTLFDSSFSNWQRLKQLIEWAQTNLANWNQIFGISKRIRGVKNPDIVMYAALAEITTAKYLALRKFNQITFNKTGIDIQAVFQDQLWNVEATFISGEDFKTQEAVYPSHDELLSPTYRLDSKKLVEKLKFKYQEECDQLKKHFKNTDNCAVVIVTHLLETYAPWLSHERSDGVHPIEVFVTSCEIPTIVIGSGTIYEPNASFVTGKFPIDDL